MSIIKENYFSELENKNKIQLLQKRKYFFGLKSKELNYSQKKTTFVYNLKAMGNSPLGSIIQFFNYIIQ